MALSTPSGKKLYIRIRYPAVHSFIARSRCLKVARYPVSWNRISGTSIA